MWAYDPSPSGLRDPSSSVAAQRDAAPHGWSCTPDCPAMGARRLFHLGGYMAAAARVSQSGPTCVPELQKNGSSRSLHFVNPFTIESGVRRDGSWGQAVGG